MSTIRLSSHNAGRLPVAVALGLLVPVALAGCGAPHASLDGVHPAAHDAVVHEAAAAEAASASASAEQVVSQTAATVAEPRSQKSGVRSEVDRYLELNRTIQLTPAEEAIRRAALSDLPAPCCKNFSSATCCCPCNLAKTMWGLSKGMIRGGSTAKEVRAEVEGWLARLNPAEYDGHACNKGRCELPMTGDACGGMQEGTVKF